MRDFKDLLLISTTKWIKDIMEFVSNPLKKNYADVTGHTSVVHGPSVIVLLVQKNNSYVHRPSSTVSILNSTNLITYKCFNKGIFNMAATLISLVKYASPDERRDEHCTYCSALFTGD